MLLKIRWIVFSDGKQCGQHWVPVRPGRRHRSDRVIPEGSRFSYVILLYADVSHIVGVNLYSDMEFLCYSCVCVA